MASAFSHGIAAVALGSCFKAQNKKKLLFLGAMCAIFPDADVIAFALNIPYEHVFGHRGITHSLLFSIVFGFVTAALFYRKLLWQPNGWRLVFYFALCTASHAVLDAITNGGLGVAFFAPLENSRYFFPFRPVQVSPIGVSNFFSEWGLRVIKSELLWIWLPCFAFMGIVSGIRKLISRA